MSPLLHPPHRRTSEYNLRIMSKYMVACVAVITSVSASQGFELPPEQVATYLQSSLSNSSALLRKPDKVGPVGFHRSCMDIGPDKCNTSFLNKRFKGMLGGNSRVKLTAEKDNPDIKLIIASGFGAVVAKRDLSASYVGGFSDSDDPDCQLYYSIKDNMIKKVVIVVSLDSPELKQKFCMASQFMQGLGLALPYGMPFSKLWRRPPDGQNAFTDKNVSDLTESYGILSYIHMCPESKARHERQPR